LGEERHVFPGSPFKAPTAKAVEAFQKVLVDHRFTAVVRQSRGKDILAACGQLSGRHREETTGSEEVKKIGR